MKRITTLDRHCNSKCGWECEGCPYKKRIIGRFLLIIEDDTGTARRYAKALRNELPWECKIERSE